MRSKRERGIMNMKKLNVCIMVIVYLFLWTHEIGAQKNTIVIIGTGYVGLVTGTCLAECGHTVICADINKSKIDLLHQNIMPIFEPGLEEMVKRNVGAERLFFTTDIDQALEQADCIFVAVDTPMNSDGYADMTAINQVFSSITGHLDRYKIICVKSTVPIGTGARLLESLQQAGVDPENYDLVSNPEFLREGNAIHDFLEPDRIIIGTASPKAQDYMRMIYKSFMEKNIPCIFTNIVSAETIKYASNAFLATKIGFINEMANLCDQTGADIADVANGMGLDNRIGRAFLKPGPGFGGSCFPKDCHALDKLARFLGVPLHIVSAALHANENQKKKPGEKLIALMNDGLRGKTIAVLGLAFKNNTDDVRSSPAITTINFLLEKGAIVHAYDPAAIENMQKIFPTISYFHSLYDALKGADAIIIMTEWDEFKFMDLGKIAELVHQRILVDARNLLDPMELKKYGFSYLMMGRP